MTEPCCKGRSCPKCRPARELLLWQIAELFGQVARLRLFWAIQMPEIYGEWFR